MLLSPLPTGPSACASFRPELFAHTHLYQLFIFDHTAAPRLLPPVESRISTPATSPPGPGLYEFYLPLDTLDYDKKLDYSDPRRTLQRAHFRPYYIAGFDAHGTLKTYARGAHASEWCGHIVIHSLPYRIKPHQRFEDRPRNMGMSLANSRKLNGFSGSDTNVEDMSTAKHTSCLFSRSHGLRPTTTLHDSCCIAKRSGERRDLSRAREESTRIASAYGSALGRLG